MVGSTVSSSRTNLLMGRGIQPQSPRPLLPVNSNFEALEIQQPPVVSLFLLGQEPEGSRAMICSWPISPAKYLLASQLGDHRTRPAVLKGEAPAKIMHAIVELDCTTAVILIVYHNKNLYSSSPPKWPVFNFCPERSWPLLFIRLEYRLNTTAGRRK
jgi:hypothetical protein